MIDVLNTNYYIAKKKSIYLKLNRLENMPIKLIGDNNRITQVTNNLVNNAIEFAKLKSVAEITASYDNAI